MKTTTKLLAAAVLFAGLVFANQVMAYTGISKGFIKADLKTVIQLTERCRGTMAERECGQLERWLIVFIPTHDPFDQRLDPNDKTPLTETLKEVLLDAEATLKAFKEKQQ